MTQTYRCPQIDPQWRMTRDTDQIVAVAIHAVAENGSRSPEAIWDEPTPAECDHVSEAVAQYLTNGDFPRSDDDRYHWGCEAIRVTA